MTYQFIEKLYTNDCDRTVNISSPEYRNNIQSKRQKIKSKLAKHKSKQNKVPTRQHSSRARCTTSLYHAARSIGREIPVSRYECIIQYSLKSRQMYELILLYINKR